jgi:BirA family transcriptional regulator, biotin operon repressor / biotin---[acetyl-CoA-carboxylase] ligase
VRLRPTPPPRTWGWLPLLVGVALVDALRTVALSASPSLKWPNDVLVGQPPRKAAGILLEARGEVAVAGFGLNVHQTVDQLPVPTATSLALVGVDVDRSVLLREVLTALAARVSGWEDVDGDAARAGLLEAYTERCSTIGQQVSVTRPGGVLTGRAVRVAPDAGLVVATAAGETTVVAGDVTHVRPVG